MLYNLSEFITLIKEDIGIKDVPLPVDDQAIAERIKMSSLREFSVRYPYMVDIVLTPKDMIDDSRRNIDRSVLYQIPLREYDGSKVLAVYGITGTGYGSEQSMYVPTLVSMNAPDMIATIADIKLAASMGSSMIHAPTFDFRPPDKLRVYDAWSVGSMIAHCGLLHDPSLSTIPDTAMTHFRQLAVLDIEAYLYNKLKRITDIDTGVGTINLRIDNWENAATEMRDLLREWDETGNLDTDWIQYFT